ncbi:3-deoxy-D-manno-octulosonic acid transferase [Edaphobacter dinghuensis]|uniref:3-deoxy-D-manno-octulosonic acid transferase n=1 Tax=Edaphobacter dinghuensis TaxID=1560005 RepID=A0A917MB22_9BACT|nr:3-deoxy-D-manno-octulosonic acid transferase [Edaphobacter dinghuensis]GGG88695.1 3-deoxy-D-manno-octulosonic acid transferase [Edaphobacter dinghuensis]
MGVYSALLLAALVLGAPWWLLRMATSGRYRAGLAGRLGFVPKQLRAAVAGREVVWVHAVSVGEVMAATQLIRELSAARPEWLIAVSTTTATGQRLAKQRLPELPVFYLPLDFAFVVRRYLRVLQPKLLVLMESELWPNLILQCAKAGVPMAVVNARVSDRSFPRYMRLRRLWRPLLEKISLFLAQSEETAERLVQIGAPAERVQVTGNLKYDLREGRESPLVAMLRDQLPAKARVVVCGSTLDGEEKILLAAWPAVLAAEPDAVMVLAPRHPDRFSAVAAMIGRDGFTTLRASEFREHPAPLTAGSIFLLDTIGDLAAAYSLGAVAFVGGSLVKAGGHNPLEPARFGVAVMTGASFENFREIVNVLQKHDAIRIISATAFTETAIALLRDTDEAHAIGARARSVFDMQAGATARTVQALTALALTGLSKGSVGSVR